MVEAKTIKSGHKKAKILGVEIDISSMKEVLNEIASKTQKSAFIGPKNRPFFVVTVNVEFVVEAQDDRVFRDILNKAGIAIADGWGLKLANWNLKIVPGRKIVSDLVTSKVYRIFYLGGINGVAKEMAEKYDGEWDEGHQNIRIENGQWKIDNERIVEKINKFRPDILLVAYGAPAQEKWLAANSHRLKAKVVMGVGGAFDYLTGKTKLPPEWMSKIGLEWLWRLTQEPWRWRRQMRLLKFVWLVLKAKVSTG